uniref:Uncharacterized protein n=1 Tax=Micrurus paraensis TaxID=1970185 RepID=A0A2D4K8E5_9SAUR
MKLTKQENNFSVHMFTYRSRFFSCQCALSVIPMPSHVWFPFLPFSFIIPERFHSLKANSPDCDVDEDLGFHLQTCKIGKEQSINVYTTGKSPDNGFHRYSCVFAWNWDCQHAFRAASIHQNSGLFRYNG